MNEYNVSICLDLCARRCPWFVVVPEEARDAFSKALSQIDFIKNAVLEGCLVPDVVTIGVPDTCALKRKTVDRRGGN
jgi:hypothetical protein